MNFSWSDRMEAPPVVDLAPFLEEVLKPGVTERRQEALKNINQACKEFGLFQLINHGVNPELLGKVRENVERFFELPLDDKLKYATGSTFGFVHKSGAPGNLPDRKEHFFSAMDDHCASQFNVWPDSPPTFRLDAVALAKQMQTLSCLVMDVLSESLEVSKERLSSCFERTEDYFNVLFYPACADYEGQVLAPHQDGTIFTMVSQLNRVPGYQVLKDGRWYTVMPEEDSLIVNLGDLLQVWTNGVYKGAVHRVVASKTHRYSFVYNHSPEGKTWVAPLPEFVDERPLYRSFTLADYLKLRMENKVLGNKLRKAVNIEHYAV